MKKKKEGILALGLGINDEISETPKDIEFLHANAKLGGLIRQNFLLFVPYPLDVYA